MNLYMTPSFFRRANTGIDLTDVSDAELLSTLHAASAATDAYCNVPMLPQKHDFRGGTSTAEQHAWQVDAYERPRPFRFWPWHQPVRTVTEFKIYATPDVFLEIEPNEIFIHNSGGWIEVSTIRLTQYAVFGAGVLTTMVGLFDPIAVASYTYGWQFVVVDQPLATADQETYWAQDQWWDNTADVEVKVNGAVEAPSGYTVDYDEGTILFDTAQDPTDVVVASFTHKLPWELVHGVELVVADMYGEIAMRERGMTGVDQLRVGEIEIRRAGAGARTGSSSGSLAISPRAQLFLDDFQTITVR